MKKFYWMGIYLLILSTSVKAAESLTMPEEASLPTSDFLVMPEDVDVTLLMIPRKSATVGTKRTRALRSPLPAQDPIAKKQSIRQKYSSSSQTIQAHDALKLLASTALVPADERITPKKRSGIVYAPSLSSIPEDRPATQKSAFVQVTHAAAKSAPQFVPSPNMHPLSEPVQSRDDHKKSDVSCLETIRKLNAQKPGTRKEYVAQQKAIREATLVQLKADYLQLSSAYNNTEKEKRTEETYKAGLSLYNLIQKIENPCPCLTTRQPCRKCDIYIE